MPFTTEILRFDDAAIMRAAAVIANGLPVAITSETVYGLAADAGSGAAVAAIYAAKGRPSFNPLIVHVSDLAEAESLAIFDPVARRLAKEFWPGPLTLVLPLRADAPIATLATAGLGTIGLRVPAHPAMRALLAASGRPLAAPSANKSGTISPTRAEHVRQSLGGRIPLIIDAGPTSLGIESTIVSISEAGLFLLRPGPLTAEQLSQVTGMPVLEPVDSAIQAPGQLASHYAPTKPLRLEATQAESDEWLIGFGGIAGDVSLSPSGDLIEAAARLFDLLHEADKQARSAIAVAPIPKEGLGFSINDRLQRAAAPRD